MKYKIIELNERNITDFNGKIIQIIDSCRKNLIPERDYFPARYIWVLTCLVEVTDDE